MEITREWAWDRLTAIAELPLDELRNGDLAERNLLCAAGLPGTEDLDIEFCLARLEEWTELVRLGTRRMLPRFDAHRDQFKTEAEFRMAVLIRVLRQNLGVQYDPQEIGDLADEAFRNKPMPNARPIFLHGILQHGVGTCSSLPVLYVAIGRRVGYPLFLCRAKMHYFVRWDEWDRNLSFNIEATSPGLLVRDDEHYRHWPYPLSAEEAESGHYVRSLNPREEFAAFLGSRGFCLYDNREYDDALKAVCLAACLDPGYSGYEKLRYAASTRRVQQLTGIDVHARSHWEPTGDSVLDHFPFQDVAAAMQRHSPP